jgi:polysaccharide export outer membrane protein
MRLRTLFAIAALLLGPLAGCASRGANLPSLESAQAAGVSGSSAGYLLGPGDKLRMTVFGAEDLSGDFTVGQSGVINLPLIGGVKASGLSPEDFARAVETKLKDGYMRDPKVAVHLDRYRPILIFCELLNSGL